MFSFNDSYEAGAVILAGLFLLVAIVVRVWQSVRRSRKSNVAKRKLRTVVPDFRQLRQSIQRISESMDPLTGIVRFFDAVSKWQDRGIGDLIMAFEKTNYCGQHDGVIERLRTLQKHFSNAGRCEYGLNRTKPGQRVTEDVVYLGDIYGLYTKPVSFWRQKRDEPKGGWGFSDMEHLNAYDVVSDQARQFMASHIKPMVKIIGELETVAA